MTKLTSLKTIKLITIAAASLLVAACTSTFRSDVTSFHKLPEPKGAKVSIVPIDPAKKDSLEFQAYAAKVGSELMKLGYVPAKDAKPDLIVGLDYAINDGREKLRNYATFGGAYWRGWGGFGFWNRYDPFFMGPAGGFDNELRASTVYKTTLNIEFRHLDGKKLYEGRAESETSAKSLPVLVPKLVESLFQNFPGPSGQTVRVVVKEEKK